MCYCRCISNGSPTNWTKSNTARLMVTLTWKYSAESEYKQTLVKLLIIVIFISISVCMYTREVADFEWFIKKIRSHEWRLVSSKTFNTELHHYYSVLYYVERTHEEPRPKTSPYWEFRISFFSASKTLYIRFIRRSFLRANLILFRRASACSICSSQSIPRCSHCCDWTWY